MSTESPEATTAVAVRPNVARPLILAEVLTVEAQQRDLLGQYVKRHMVAGSDYGVIPGTNKPTLLKPGAEKLIDLFRCTPAYEIIERIEDWDKPLFHYLFRVRIESRETGVVVAEGYGSANSRESRYRWRNGERKCPNCGKATIIKGKSEFGGGWVCFAKKGGCNSKYRDGDRAIEAQEVGRVENPDICDQANTILKMAKKRALVDASIALARCSDLFTQDLEDGDDEPVPVPTPPPTPTPTPNREPGDDGLITTNTANAINAALKTLGLQWGSPAIMDRVGGTIGRGVAYHEKVDELSEAEGKTLLTALNQAIANKAKAPKQGAATP